MFNYIIVFMTPQSILIEADSHEETATHIVLKKNGSGLPVAKFRLDCIAGYLCKLAAEPGSPVIPDSVSRLTQ